MKAALLALALPLAAKPLQVKAPVGGCGETTFSFDTDRISESDLLRLAALHPEAVGDEAVFLELCVEGDPAYLPCGSRGLDAPNFLANARTNVIRLEEQLSRLEALAKSVPKELKPLAEHRLRGKRASAALEKTRLEYLRSWDAALLRRPVLGVDPKTAAAAALKAVDAAAGPAERYKLVQHVWHNAMTEALAKTQGEPPKGAWAEFARLHGIEERTDHLEECD